MMIQVNGRDVPLKGPIPLLDYLDANKVRPELVAIELNGVILERSTLAASVIRPGDIVEIVRIIGGG